MEGQATSAPPTDEPDPDPPPRLGQIDQPHPTASAANQAGDTTGLPETGDFDRGPVRSPAAEPKSAPDQPPTTPLPLNPRATFTAGLALRPFSSCPLVPIALRN